MAKRCKYCGSSAAKSVYLPTRKKTINYCDNCIPPSDDVNPVKKIKCLKCEQPFVAKGKYNKVCTMCKNSGEWKDN